MNKFLVILILFFLSCKDNIQSNKKVVVIQPLSEFPIHLTDTIRKSIEDYYHFNTIVYEVIEMPNTSYINIKTPRYRADSLLRFLRNIKPDSVNYIIGLTVKDISTTKYDTNGKVKLPTFKYKDWGVFGLGFCPGVSCVMSNFRIKHPNQVIYIDRIKKITLHELGHNIGLHHCDNKNCFMTDAAESISTIDQVELNLCENCKSIIGKK